MKCRNSSSVLMRLKCASRRKHEILKNWINNWWKDIIRDFRRNFSKLNKQKKVTSMWYNKSSQVIKNLCLGFLKQERNVISLIKLNNPSNHLMMKTNPSHADEITIEIELCWVSCIWFQDCDAKNSSLCSMMGNWWILICPYDFSLQNFIGKDFER